MFANGIIYLNRIMLVENEISVLYHYVSVRGDDV